MNPCSSKNVQAIVPGETHKKLRDIAYTIGKPLKDLIREVLVEFADKNTPQTKDA